MQGSHRPAEPFRPAGHLADGDRCEGCGFVFELGAAANSPRPVAGRMAEVAELLLTTADVDVCTRLDATTWSPLEYACHLRDMLLVQRERVLAARRVSRAEALTMGRDERVEYDGYADQAPVDVARQLIDAAAMYVRVIERLGEADWNRTLMHGPDERPLRWTVTQAHHEAVHHLADIRRQLRHSDSAARP